VNGAVVEAGFAAALMSTFDLSVIVWSAWVISLMFLLQGPAQPVSRSDRIVAACVLLLLLVPAAPVSWLALTGLAIHVLRTVPRSSPLSRGGWILLALTVPMLWTRLLFAAFSDVILLADATLVGWLVGTPRIGNAVQFADGSGYLWIASGCSSLANVSLAILCWITITKTLGRQSSWRDLAWVGLACAAVIAINVVRVSLMGLYPAHFDLIHGPVGATIASWLILGSTGAICLIGARRDLPARPPVKSAMIVRPATAACFALVLALSLLFRLPGLAHLTTTETPVTLFPGNVATLLGQQGFEVGQVTPVNDLAWVYGNAWQCHLHITEVAPHGWQQSLLAGMAGEDRLVYLFAGKIRSEQPIATRAEYYWRKLNRYLGRSAPVRPVLAVISTPACSDTLLHELAILSDT
jgi:hypothetical protein